MKKEIKTQYDRDGIQEIFGSIKNETSENFDNLFTLEQYHQLHTQILAFHSIIRYFNFFLQKVNPIYHHLFYMFSIILMKNY